MKQAFAPASIQRSSYRRFFDYAGLVTSRVEEGSGEWAPMRASVDVERFDRGRIGPYLIGNSLRSTDFGEVSMALHDALDRVVELEMFQELADSPAARPDGKLMPDLAIAAQAEHPNVARIIGAGIDGGVPYVVRPLVLGRTLAQFVRHGGPPPTELAACVVFAVAEAVHALAQLGPEPGSCSIGGFDDRDVFLAFEGTVLILGSGTKEIRAPGVEGAEVALRDFEGAVSLADELGLGREIEGARDCADLVRRLRHAHRDALGRRRELAGIALRDRFDATIHEERAFFGLSPIQ